MGVLGGGGFLISEVPLYTLPRKTTQVSMLKRERERERERERARARARACERRRERTKGRH